MMTIWTDKIKHSTVGSSFSVTFSVAPNELEYLNKLYDCFNSINMSSFPITADRKTENSSEIPNNCEHITEDGVTCAKYPACDDCLDNPLNKVKGSKRLVKGKDEPQKLDCRNKKYYSSCEYANKCHPTVCFKALDEFKEKLKDEPQTEREGER